MSRVPLARHPIASTGCYTLPMVCAAAVHEGVELVEWYSQEFVERNSRDAFRAARKAGWKRIRGERNLWLCPKCVRDQPKEGV